MSAVLIFVLFFVVCINSMALAHLAHIEEYK